MKKDKPPVLAKKEHPLHSTMVSVQPNHTHPTATAATTQQSSKLAYLDKTFLGLKKELNSIKAASEGSLSVGVVKSGNPVVNPASKSTTTSKVLPSQVLLQARPAISSTSGALSSNCRVAPSKSAKVNTITLGVKSNPTSSVATYLLSAGSLDIAQLLQAHLQQKGTGSVQLPALASTSLNKGSGPSSQGVRFLPSTLASSTKEVESKNKKVVVTATLKPLTSSDRVVTVVSASQAARVTPAVIQVAQTPVASHDQAAPSPNSTGTTTLSRPMAMGSTDNKKLVSAMSTSHSLSAALLTSKEKSDLPPPGAGPGSRLHLIKKNFSTPQVIFPGQSEPTKKIHHPEASSKDSQTSSSDSTKTPPLSNRGPTSTPPLVTSAIGSGCVTSHVCTLSTGGSVGHVAISAATPTAVQPVALSSAKIVDVVPDTPPQSLPGPAPISVATSTPSYSQVARLGELLPQPTSRAPLLPRPTSRAPLLSPLKSPVELILGEHSYVGRPFITSTEPDKEEL